MSDVKDWEQGESIRLDSTYTDADDAAFDPVTIELKIYEPDGTLKATVTYALGEIIKSATGIYYYDYDIPSDADLGWWISRWTATATDFSDVTKGQFKVVDPEKKLYCTADEVWLRAGQDETFVVKDNVINYIKQSMVEIDEIYQKSFNYSNDKTEYFDTSQPDENVKVTSIFLTFTPVRAITSVKEYDTSGNEVADHEAADYWLDSGTGMIQLRTEEFGHQKHRVEVIYTYGFDTIPNKINNLCIILSAMKVLLNFIGESVDQVTSYNACGISVSVGEPYTASAKAIEILIKERDKLLSEIGRLRPSIFIV
jgi:hypothetical protein